MKNGSLFNAGNGPSTQAHSRRLRPACLFGFILGLLGLFARAAQPQSPTTGWRPDLDHHYGKTCVNSECHPTEDGGKLLKHPPYFEGHCLACHLDHESSQKGLLREGGNKVCLTCHTDLEVDPQSSSLLHPPGDQPCVECHNPHSSPFRNFIRDEEKLLVCAKCHEKFLDDSAKRPYHHEYFNPRGQCGECHYAHKRGAKKHVRENAAESCQTCHDLGIKVDDRTLENVGKRLREAHYIHEPLKGESCPTCHIPHGADQPALLKEGYPAGTHQTYSSGAYELCWTCHDKALAENPEAVGVTNFRDGEKNLHRLHLVELKRGRACHLCHEAHTSDVPHLIRKHVRFGDWGAELTYKPTADGGSCLTPCHLEKKYSRNAKRPPQQPKN
ncbi:MAG: cytochrome c3 family protein [bacterium]